MTTHITPTTDHTDNAGTLVGFSPEVVQRVAGAALAVGGTLCIAGGALHPVVDGAGHSVAALTSPTAPVAAPLLAVGTTLLVVSIPTLHGWLSGRIGRLGSVGLLAYLLGNLVTACAHLTVETFVAAPLASDPSTAGLIATDDSMIGTTAFAALNQVGGIVMLAGMAAFGIDLLRNAPVPRWIGALTTVGMVGFFLPIPMTPVLSGLIYEVPRGVAIAALGIAMARRPGRARRRRC